jgi:hypothetical protein
LYKFGSNVERERASFSLMYPGSRNPGSNQSASRLFRQTGATGNFGVSLDAPDTVIVGIQDSIFYGIVVKWQPLFLSFDTTVYVAS